MKNIVFGFVIVILLAIAFAGTSISASASNDDPTHTPKPTKVMAVYHHFDNGEGNGGCVEHTYEVDHAPTGWALGSCPPEPTATNTQEPTATPTDVPPTATPTDIPTDEPTSTPTEVVQPTATPTTEMIEATATPTEQEDEPTATGTPVFVVTNTPHPENQCWRAYMHHDLKYILRHMESGVIRCFAGPKFPVERNENGSIVSHHH